MKSGGAGGLRSWLQTRDQALTAPLQLAAVPRTAGSRAARGVGLALAHSGDSYVWGALCVAAWFLGDGSWRLRGVLVAAGLVAAQALVSLIKAIVRRSRPPGTAGSIYRKADPFSFPSGHAARAALLCILACRLGPLPLAIAICLWSPFMVLSRIAIGIHYVFDVVGGLLLGAGVAVLILWATPLAEEAVRRLSAALGM